MPRIIVLDPIAKEGHDLLKAAPGIEYEVRTGLKGDALRTALAEFDGAICRSGVTITAESLEGNKRLRAIVRAGVGVDNIDREAATRLGMVVMNTPAGNTISTAEHTFTLMLALSRSVAPAYGSLCQGKWDRKLFMGTQLAEKTLGVVGMGRIGQEVAKRALAFQMKVIGYDPFFTDEQAARMGVERVATARDLLPRVDYLTVHTPLTNETRDLVDMAALDVLKPGVRLINCARGGIYNEAALVEGLKSKKIGGVALDVFEEEPCVNSPLFGMPNVLCTPHLGASTEEAQTLVAVEAVHLLVNYLTTGEVRHAVNMPPIDPKTLAAARGYLNLAHRLGLLLAQVQTGGGVSACHLTYRGEGTHRNSRLITAAFCAGLMHQAFDEDVNVVNAELLLKERGIRVTEELRSDVGAFSSSIAANVTDSQGKTFNASGTLFGNDMPRLIRLLGFRLEAYLDGTLLIFCHRDVPGIIGAVGTIFGKHKVNIGQMSVGRMEAGGDAVGVLNLDGVPPVDALREVESHPDVQRVQVIAMPAAEELPPWLRTP